MWCIMSWEVLWPLITWEQHLLFRPRLSSITVIGTPASARMFVTCRIYEAQKIRPAVGLAAPSVHIFTLNSVKLPEVARHYVSYRNYIGSKRGSCQEKHDTL